MNSNFSITSAYKILKGSFARTPDLIFFGLFLFCIPLNIRKFFGTIIPYSSEIFNEWTSAFLYITDILLMLVAILWIQRVREKSEKPSLHTNALIAAGIIFIAFALVSAVFSPFQEIGLYGVVRLLGFVFVFVYVAANVVTSKRRICVALILFSAGSIQAIIAILQFINQKSLGLKFLGESVLSVDMPNVAEIVFAGFPLLRSYGTFPHPNVLGYFLIATILFALYLFIKIPYPRFRLSVAFLAGLQFMALILTFSRTAWLGLLIGFSTLVFTLILRKEWSCGHLNICGKTVDKKLYTVQRLKNVKMSHVEHYSLQSTNCRVQGTDHKMHIFEGLKGATIISIFFFIFICVVSVYILSPLIFNRATFSDNYGDMAVSLRKDLNEKAISLIKDRPVIGFGPKSFVPMLDVFRFSEKPIESWMYQPVHNVYLEVLAEIGIWGFVSVVGIVILQMFSLFKDLRRLLRNSEKIKNVPCGTLQRQALNAKHQALNTLDIGRQACSFNFSLNKKGSVEPEFEEYIFKAIILGIIIASLVIMPFDHYIWDVENGGLLFWTVLGL